MFQIKQLADQIFLFKFECGVELALTFLRFQEFYESPNPEFQGKSFTIDSFKTWYTQDRNSDEFTYPTDWVGFNIPSRVIESALSLGIPDKNCYDDLMLGSYELIKRKCGNQKFYIIGVSKIESAATLKHELAHGLYYTNEKYRAEIDAVTSTITPELHKIFYNKITRMGYAADVVDDEIQAYLSATGFKVKCSKVQRKEYAALRKVYRNIFTKYYKLFNVRL